MPDVTAPRVGTAAWLGDRAPLLLAGVALAAIAALGAFGVAASPRTLAIVANPPDARITLGDGRSSIGEMRAVVTGPERVRVTVSRIGYVPVSTTLRPQRGPSQPTLVSLEPGRVRLFATAAPGDALLSVYRGSQRVLVGVRRVGGTLPSGEYRIVAEVPGWKGARSERAVVLDRATRLQMLVDRPSQRTKTIGVLEATGALRGLTFSADGSLLAGALLEGQRDREVFSLASLRRVPDAGAATMRAAGFSAGTVGTTVLNRKTRVRYAIDATGSALWAGRDGERARQLAKLPSKPTMLALAMNGRAIVVGMEAQCDRYGAQLPAVIVIAPDGRVVDRIDSPAVTAIAVAPDQRTLAVADTMDGRIRLLRLPDRWPAQR